MISCIRYKAWDALVSDIRPWPYNRGNTVREALMKFGYSNIYTDQGQVYRNAYNNRSMKIRSIRDIRRE